MALGVDQMFAQACIDLGIAFHAYVPFPGQESIWPESSQREYRRILDHAAKVLYGHSEKPADKSAAAQLLNQRNTDMVKASDSAIAVWDGTKGGTGNCVRDIKTFHRPWLQVNPRTILDTDSITAPLNWM